MKSVYLILFLSISFTANAQELIGKPKAETRRALLQLVAAKDTVSRQFRETDSTMVVTSHYKTRATSIVSVFGFNKAGICIEEKVKADCAACMAPYLEMVLAKKTYNWKKINEHQYISGFEQKMFLELPPEGELSSFMIFRVEWSKEMYEVLRTSSVNGVKE